VPTSCPYPEPAWSRPFPPHPTSWIVVIYLKFVINLWAKTVGTVRNIFLFLKNLLISSNKSTNQMHQSLRFIARRLNTAQHVSDRPDRPRPTTQLPPRSNGKPKAATAVYKLLMMGMKMPETCWAVFRVCGSVHLQSLKTPNWMQQSIVKFYCFVVQTLLNIFFNSWFRALWFNVNKKVQLDATVCRHLFTARSLYMFRVSQQSWSGHAGRK